MQIVDDRADEGYSRLSEDDQETEYGVERQEAGGDTLRERLALPPVTTWHRENDVSASEYSAKPRPVFAGVLNRIRTSKVRSITAYSQERITRREDEWMLFAGLCRANNVKVYLENRGGLIDIVSATGKLTSGLFALLGAYESALISERVRNANHQRRTMLLLPSPTAVRAFGFETDGHTHREREAAAIRAAAPILLAQESLTPVRRFFVSEGIKPVKVDLWSTPSLRSVFLRPRVAGLIDHKGEILGEGLFEPILNRPEWDACREVLAVKQPRAADATARKHLLSGFLICGRCAHPMVARGRELGRNARYGCLRDRGGCGGVMRTMRMVDPWVDGFMRKWLDVHSGAALSEDLDDETAKLADHLADLHAEIKVYDDEKAAGRMKPIDWVRAVNGVREQIDGVQAQQGKTHKAKATVDVDPRDVWETGSLEQRRALLRRAVGGFIVKPVGKVGSKGAPPDSIEALPPTLV